MAEFGVMTFRGFLGRREKRKRVKDILHLHLHTVFRNSNGFHELIMGGKWGGREKKNFVLFSSTTQGFLREINRGKGAPFRLGRGLSQIGIPPEIPPLRRERNCEKILGGVQSKGAVHGLLACLPPLRTRRGSQAPDRVITDQAGSGSGRERTGRDGAAINQAFDGRCFIFPLHHHVLFPPIARFWFAKHSIEFGKGGVRWNCCFLPPWIFWISMIFVLTSSKALWSFVLLFWGRRRRLEV